MSAETVQRGVASITASGLICFESLHCLAFNKSRGHEMDTNKALLLVRQKYLEETGGASTGETASQYVQACKDFPVVMAIALQLWARELAKGLP